MNKLAKLTILFLIILLPFTLLLSQDGKYHTPMSFRDEAEYIEYRISRINDVSITTFSKEIFVGKIFAMTDSSLSICKFHSCTDWRTQPVLSFAYSEINKLVVMKRRRGPIGPVTGFLIGATIGAIVGYIDTKSCIEPFIACPELVDASFPNVFGFGISGVLIGAIASATVKDQTYYITGNINLFKTIGKMIGNEAIFF